MNLERDLNNLFDSKIKNHLEETETSQKSEIEDIDEKYEKYLNVLTDWTDRAWDERRENEEITIPEKINGYPNLADAKYFSFVLQVGDKILLQRLKNSVPTVELVTLAEKDSDEEFTYATSSGKKFTAKWENLVRGDETISSTNKRAIKILRIFPIDAKIDVSQIMDPYKKPVVVNPSALTPPFDVPNTADAEYFKTNLYIGQILVSKRYKPSRNGMELVNNQLIIDDKTDNYIRVKYIFDGRPVWTKNIYYGRIYANENNLPQTDNAIFVSRVLKSSSGGNNDFYYRKYLKYKAKYIKLKNA